MADLRVCSPTSYFADDIVENCADCGGPIYLRPHGEMGCKKVCLGCFKKLDVNLWDAEIPAETSREIFDLKKSGNWPVKPLKVN